MRLGWRLGMHKCNICAKTANQISTSEQNWTERKQYSMKMTIEEFCRKHRACKEDMKWAVENCKDMDDVWQKAKPELLVWVATCEGVLKDKELRLFTVWCARQVQHLMTDDRSIAAIDVAERFANGNATDEELNEACRVARVVVWAAVEPPTNRVTWTAAWVALKTVDDAAWAAWDASEAVSYMVGEALRDAQAEYLRQNCKPNFNL